MKWDAVVRAVVDRIAADPELVALYPTRRYAGTGKLTAPLLEHMVVADAEDELWDAVVVQFDQWCLTFDNLQAGERRLRALFHLETQRDIGGMPMWGSYQDGETTASPDRDNFFGRAIRFRLTVLRERYEPSPLP